MNLTLWIVAGLLAAIFLASGLQKLFQPTEKLVAGGYGWVEDLGGGTVKVIGVLEVMAAVGLILPAALDIVPVLVPLAAAGVVLLMAGAVVVHVRRHETRTVAVPLTLLAMAALVAWGRFGPQSFAS
ncbi:DoxX family protein [Actinophytocola sediminis]